MTRLIKLSLALACCVYGSNVSAEESSAADIAKKLQNPVAAMISVPVQVNYDHNIGSVDKGEKWLTNIQPVVPFDLNADWNLISRTVIPVISQDIGGHSESGVGNILQSFFFSPKEPTESGWIWGAGPVVMLPAAESELGVDSWAAGPTAVFLKQKNGWTYGSLFNHMWGGGEDSKTGQTDVNATYIQPFFGYTWPSSVSLFLSSETTINWENDTETVPVNLVASRVVKLGGQTFSIGAGVRYWLKSPDAGPEGFGFRMMMTWLIPK